MPNSFLTNKNLELILFGGKGGTGKTTSATATALHLAQTTKKKILIVSTDPAPSIGDSLDLKVGNKITQIRENLWALEIEASELLEDFRKKNLGKIKTLIVRGTYLTEEDIEVFENLALPGMDEVMAIIKIADLLKTQKYDLIILDTAPTGHTKVLLSLPEKMERWIGIMNLMQEKHRFLKRHWTGRKYVKDEYDRFLENLKADITGVEDLLKDYNLTEFVPVTIPEPMSILETEALLEDLKRMGIKVESLLVNRVMTCPVRNDISNGVQEKCPLCTSRMKGQENYLKMIEKKFSAKGGSASGGKDYNLVKMPLFPTEIRGQDSLNEYAKILFEEKKFEIALPKIPPKFPKIPEAKMAEFLKKDLNFIICGGKGGVGKTSLAAATAIALAKKHKDKKILITTTDPAHALSNIFDQDIPLDTEAVPIEGFDNLFALEIDTEKKFQDWKNEYRQDIKDLFEKFLPEGVDIAYDREVLEELMEFSPPGLEELMALREVIDLIKGAKYDFYVLDSAASGHLLRFLELPNLIRDWLKSIFKILRKYQGLKLEGVAQRTVDLSRDIRKAQEILFNNPKTEFILLTIAEEMGLQITADLAKSLEKLGVNYNYIVANFINPASKCNFCLAKRADQEKYISRVRKEYPKKEIVLVHLFPRDIRGIKSLQELSKFIFG